eukprot:TRINITY_DN5869_c0_g2_i2.p1 TRINITY_DN5869_c0_g2~~TRINITY_DN5869_c0_g2_i2.p1  ORF type:complete len:210 (-),score=31.10 TRINITY_DN5869_c0_g2_i2:641-1270(-)
MKANSNNVPKELRLSAKIINVSDLLFAGDCSLQCSLLFLNQRVEGNIVKYANGVAVFNDVFAFKLKYIELQKYVKFNSPFHIVLMKVNNEAQEKSTIGSRKIEWRHLLYARKMDYTVPLFGVNFKQEGPLCSIRLAISFTTPLKRTELAHQHSVTHQLMQEVKLANTGRRIFDEHVSMWWQDLKAMPKLHKKDLIRIYADFDDRESLYT